MNRQPQTQIYRVGKGRIRPENTNEALDGNANGGEARNGGRGERAARGGEEKDARSAAQQ